MTLLLSGVSLSNWDWYGTHCVAQLSTESPGRNKLKWVGNKMGKTRRFLSFSLLNTFCHLSWGEFLSARSELQ